jgi:galacturan 1,4-alpha-galacturonidase
MFPFPLILARRGYNICAGDGLGGSGGIQKPAPMITLDMSGTFENVRVSCFNDHPKTFFLSNTAQILNRPQRAIAVKTNGHTVSGVTVNNGALSYLYYL